MGQVIKFPIKRANPYNTTSAPLYAAPREPKTPATKYLPMLTEAVINLIKGRCVVLFSKTKRYELGERVYLKETFCENFLGGLDCTQADYILAGGQIQNKNWQYSNRMDPRDCKRIVVVEDMFSISENDMYETFPEINEYNRQKWYFAGTESLSRFWFREKLIPSVNSANTKNMYYAYCFRLERD